MSECTYSGPSGRCHWRDEVVPALTAERDRLWVEIKRCEGALADAATVPTDNVEHGIRLLTQQLAEARAALQHVSVTSSRYRSHRSDCQAQCTCDAVEDDKQIKNEINRIVQPALARLTSPGGGTA